MVANPPKPVSAMVSAETKLASAATYAVKTTVLEDSNPDTSNSEQSHKPVCQNPPTFSSETQSKRVPWIRADQSLQPQEPSEVLEVRVEAPEQTAERSPYSGIPHPVGIAAGVVVTMTAGTIGQVMNQPPQYQGSFQLAVRSIAETDQAGAIATPQIEDTNQRITDTHVRILQSHKLIEPIVEQLRSEDSDLNYRDFIHNLSISRTSDQTLEVTYRDTNPERLQKVLKQLADTYVGYGQECRSEACRGLQFIQAQIPQIQQRITELREEIRAFHRQYGLKNLEAQVHLFSTRAAEVAKQQAEIAGKQAQSRQALSELQARMALSSEEQIAQELLEQDDRYQALLQQFRQLDQQIAIGLSTYQAEGSNLQDLEERHRVLTEDLHKEAAQILVRHINHPEANLQDPIFQEPELLDLLYQSIGMVHYLNVLEIRQQTIQQAEAEITQRKQELAVVLRHYADLRQKLQAETQVLQQYFDRQSVLQAQSNQQDAVWQVVAAPELAANANGQPKLDYLYNLQNDVGSASILGIMMGVAVGVVLEEKRRHPRSSFGMNSRIPLEPKHGRLA